MQKQSSEQRLKTENELLHDLQNKNYNQVLSNNQTTVQQDMSNMFPKSVTNLELLPNTQQQEQYQENLTKLPNQDELFNQEKQRKNSQYSQDLQQMAQKEQNQNLNKSRSNSIHRKQSINDLLSNQIAQQTFKEKFFETEELKKYKTILEDDEEDNNIFDSKQNSFEYYKNITWHYFKYLIMPSLVVVTTFISIINLVIVSYSNLGHIDQSNDSWIYGIETVIGVLFILEFLYNILMDYGNLFHRLVNFDRIIELCNIFEIFWQISDAKVFAFLHFFKIFRSLRVVKIRRQIKLQQIYFCKYILRQQDDLMLSDSSFQSDDELNKFIWSSISDLTNGIFIEATIILAVNQFRDWVAYYPFEEKGELDYITASYYVIVSFSTIGYGDIYALDYVARLVMIVLLCVNITVMSNFLGHFTYLLSQVSSYDKLYEYEQHIVILGEVPDYWLIDFLAEIVELDLIYQKKADQQKKRFIKPPGTKVIIVGTDNPSSVVRGIVSFYQNNYEYDNEVSYLKANIYDNNKSWYKKANLQKCKSIVALSLKACKDDFQSFEEDKKIALTVKQIRDSYPKQDITLILQSEICKNYQKDSLFKGINIYKSRELAECIMASSLENPGFGTILTHLLTMKKKNQPTVIDKQSLFGKYVEEMEQEIYQFNFPSFFIGKTFKEACQILYFFSIDIKQNMQNQQQNNERGILLLAVEFQTQEDNLQKFNKTSFSKSSQKMSNTLINPPNYIIQEGDIGYVIAQDVSDLQRAQNLNSQMSKGYIQYMDNMDSIERILQDTNKSQYLISQMFKKLRRNYMDYSINNDSLHDTSLNKMDNSAISRVKSVDINHLKDQTILDHIFDLETDQNKTPKDLFKNHIIIIGQQQSFVNIVHLLRKYSDRPILLFSNQQFNAFTWREMASDKTNLYFVKGNFMDLQHFYQLGIDNCYKILILGDQDGNVFIDSDQICVTKILQDHFQYSNYLIELKDEANIKFLSQNPDRTHVGSDDVAYHFWNSFVQGNVFFSSIITTAIARQIYVPNWIYFLKDLILPSTQQQQQEIGQTGLFENKIINSLTITNQTAQHFKTYGLLQFSLMNSNPNIISLGLIKNQISNREKFEKSEFMRTQKEHANLIYNFGQINTSLYKMGQFKVILTNPDFNTPLDVDDIIIIMGINENINEQGLSMKNYVLRKTRIEKQNGYGNENMESQQDFEQMIKSNNLPQSMNNQEISINSSYQQAKIYNSNIKKLVSNQARVSTIQQQEEQQKLFKNKMQERKKVIELLKQNNELLNHWTQQTKIQRKKSK